MPTQHLTDDERLNRAARSLYERLCVPPGAVSVFAWHPTDDDAAILVRVLPEYCRFAATLPPRFLGFPVVVSKAPMPQAI